MTTLSDYLAAAQQAPDPNAPAQPVRSTTLPTPAAPQTYADYFNQLRTAISAGIDAEAPLSGRGLINLLTGNDRTAAIARLQAMAPQGWQQYQTAQDALRRQQLGTMQTFAEPQAMTGVSIDPNNPMSSLPSYAKALRQYFTTLNGQGQDQSQPGAQPQPQAQPAQPQNPIQQLDAMFGPNGVNQPIVQSVESGNNPNAVSPKGANGLMQVMPQTGTNPGYGVQPLQNDSPQENQRFGRDYLGAMTQKYGSPTLGLIAYNMGPGNTDAWIKGGADPSKLPQETQDYLGKIVKAHQAAGLLQSPAQAAQPAPQQVAQNDPTAPNRALYMRLAQMRGMMGDAQGAKQFFDMANTGRPDGAIVSPTGNFTEPTINGSSGTEPARTYAADAAGMTSAAQAQGTATQTPVQVVGRNGPMTVSQADLLRNGGAGEVGRDGQLNWLPADSPQYKVIQTSQQKEIGDLRSDAALANQGLTTAQQLYNAANGLYTGKGAEAAQGIRKALQMVASATNTPVPDAITKSTSQFEQLKYAALNFVQSAAHGFSPRAAQQIVKMIQAAKPGDTTSPQGLKGIIENDIMPAYLRTRAMYSATGNYYQQNPLATDAQSKIPDQMPISNFGVKHFPQQVNPGDYFVSRHDGSLQQRPVQ